MVLWGQLSWIIFTPMISDLISKKPLIGDYLLVSFQLKEVSEEVAVSYKRNRQNYIKQKYYYIAGTLKRPYINSSVWVHAPCRIQTWVRAGLPSYRSNHSATTAGLNWRMINVIFHDTWTGGNLCTKLSLPARTTHNRIQYDNKVASYPVSKNAHSTKKTFIINLIIWLWNYGALCLMCCFNADLAVISFVEKKLFKCVERPIQYL